MRILKLKARLATKWGQDVNVASSFGRKYGHPLAVLTKANILNNLWHERGNLNI